MMGPQTGLAEACQSDIYLFVVGAEKQEYKIHAAILGRVSAPFEAMFHAEMQESTEKRVVLEDVEPATFQAVLEFAYTQMYLSRSLRKDVQDTTAHNMTPSIDEYQDSTEPRHCNHCGDKLVDPDDDELGCTRFSCHGDIAPGPYLFRYCQKCGTKKDQNKPTSSGYCAQCHRLNSTAAAQFKKFRSSVEFIGLVPGPSDNPLLHAKLYAFANKWMIAYLKKICVFLLHQDLCHITLTDATAENVCETVSEIYSNSSADESGPEGTEVRGIVLEFAVICADQLAKFEAFSALLAQGGDFVVDWGRRMAEKANC